jgi:hypothetical protein
MELLQRYTDVGANIGRWDLIHNIAANADQVGNLETKRVYATIVRVAVERHYCEECRGHGSKWLLENPPENCFNRVDGCLWHSWKFHNSVNKRLGKPEISYDVVRRWYAPLITNGVSTSHDASTNQLKLTIHK